MEPFALLNLLKSLFPTTENTPENSADNAMNADLPQNPAMRNSAPKNGENKTTEPDPSAASAPNAFLDFMEKHEKRVGQIKKK